MTQISSPCWRRALLAVGLLSLLACLGSAAAREPGSNPSNADPAAAARAVFEENDFWWKRIERVETSSYWPQRLASAIGELFREIGRFVAWLLEKLAGLFHVTAGQWPVAKALIWLAMGLALIWAAWRLYPVIARWLGRPTAEPRIGGGGELHELPEAVSLHRQAVEALSQGRYDDAIRLEMLALIARFQQQGLLRYDPARTNCEYRTDLRPTPRLATLFNDIARPFERVWYGRVPATRAAAELVIEGCGPVVNAEILKLE